jgi:hypothetical protein
VEHNAPVDQIGKHYDESFVERDALGVRRQS